MADLSAAAEAEIRARHDFFVAWFTGRASKDEMQRAAQAFAPDMQRIGPEGEAQDADAVIAMIRAAEGRIDGVFEIDIEVETVRRLSDNLILVVYIERQSIDSRTTARRSTALFSPDPDAPEGVVWRHLQETWIAQ
ncbi:hypothetical protein R5H30_18530 [Sulfitobacter sp. D35]|uniref:hypothetical protein n=1 Tax=Sulfitobacter sp. D35 TaxID=3083252 RepID=UPI00296F4CA5|nr:hypothetical protein [Sulfitobacter sp. D35]MDW4499996.1 hypothetical protein [Sulfitobacter sp. D35]